MEISSENKAISVNDFERYSYTQKLLFDNDFKETEDITSPKTDQVDCANLCKQTSKLLSYADHAMFWAYIHRKTNSKKLEKNLKAHLEKIILKVTMEQNVFSKRFNNVKVPAEISFSENIMKYANELLQNNWKSVFAYPRYYKLKDMVPLLSTGESRKPMFQHVYTPLQMGRVAYLLPPTCKTKTIRANPDYDKLIKQYPIDGASSELLYKTPISKDPNARKLALQYGANAVLTRSSLEVLFASTDSCLEAAWELPVVIEEVSSSPNKMNDIVFIDKPFKPRNMPALEKNELFYKKSLKLVVCHPKHWKAFKLNEDTVCPKLDFSKPNLPPVSSPIDYRCNDNLVCSFTRDDSSDSENEGLVIDLNNEKKIEDSASSILKRIEEENYQNSFNERLNSPTERKNCDISSLTERENSDLSSPTEENDDCCLAVSNEENLNETSFLSNVNDDATPTLRRSARLKKKTSDDINEPSSSVLGTIEKLQDKTFDKPTINELLLAAIKTSDEAIKTEAFIPPKEGFNVRYELWRIGQVNVLIRCSVDGVTYDKDKPVFNRIVPKVDYKAECGGDYLTPVECAKQWISTALLPNSKLARFRIDAFNSSIIGFQHLKLNQIVPAVAHFRPCNYVYNLITLLEKLVKQPVGNYLISHTSGEGCCKIMREVNIETTQNQLPELVKDCYDLHGAYTRVCQEDFTSSDEISFIPIDPNVILFKHEKCQQIPATFNPKGNPLGKVAKKRLLSMEWDLNPNNSAKSRFKKGYSKNKINKKEKDIVLKKNNSN